MTDSHGEIASVKKDVYENLDYGEIWMREGLRVVPHPGFFVSTEVDLSHGKELIHQVRGLGIKATYTHLFIRAAALALSRHPDLHQMVKGYRRLRPAGVDIGLSIAGTTVVAPVLVIRNAETKTLSDIAREVIERTPEIRDADMKMLAEIRKWGWLIPFGFLRRWYLKTLMKQFWFCRKGVGTFQVSCLSDVDQFVPFLFSTGAILGVGAVRDRVVAVDGRSGIRPVAVASCCVDHKVWDGVMAAKFLNELKGVIESEEMEAVA